MRVRDVILIPWIVGSIESCGATDADFVEFSRYESPDKTWTVEIDSAHSVLAYGPETIRVFVSDGRNRTRVHVVTTKIANDGTGISDENIRAEWVDRENTRFCLTGVEQRDRVLKINTRTRVHIEQDEKC